MAIKYFEANDYFIGSYVIGISEPAFSKILNTVEGLDQVIPGIKKVMEVSELGIVYDEKNRHKVFNSSHRGHRGSYYWPLHMMYLANSGIQKSIAHESAHMLDMLSGPTLEETYYLYGKELVWPKSLFCFFPKGGKVIPDEIQNHFNPENNFTGWFLVKAVANCTICRENLSVKERLLEKFSHVDLSDIETRDFLIERVAHLMEEYVFTLQKEAGISHLGVGSTRYFSNVKDQHLWWGREWIIENRNEIQQFFNQMIEAILDRHKAGKLNKRIKDMHHEYSIGFTDFLNATDSQAF
jgi:hypothetical protein